MGLFGKSKKEKEKEEAEKKKKEEEEAAAKAAEEKEKAEAATDKWKKTKGRLRGVPADTEFRVEIIEKRRPCMCLPETSSKSIARMNYDEVLCDHFETQKVEKPIASKPQDVQELENPAVVYDRARDGGVDKGKPMTEGTPQQRPRTLEEEALEDEEDDGASDDIFIPPKPRITPKPREKPPTRFNGKALDPRTGKVYYFNTKTGERKWADASEQPERLSATVIRQGQANFQTTNIQF